MADFPILPLCTDAYLADTTHLTNEEHGCYLLLLMFSWRNNRPLPDDDLKIARMLHITPGRWRTKIRPSLEPFFDLSGGFFFQKKLEIFRAAAFLKREKNYANGVRGGRPKPLNINDTIKPIGSFEETQTEPKQKPSRARVLTTSHKPKESPHTPLGGDSLFGFSEWWDGYPHKVGKGAAAKAYPKAHAAVGAAELLAGVQRYIANKPDDRPWCNPATWLNQQRWNDEPAAAKPNGSTHSPAVTPAIEKARQELRAKGILFVEAP
jgi:uncharacterized protein YdaU (DUF1376 family)